MIKYFSTFSGYGTETFAIKRNKLDWECVGWCEIDEYARMTHNANHPEYKHLLYEDITKIDWATTPDFDVLFGGFPCQAFSLAGLRKGFDDTRGTLFFNLAEGLRIKQPRAFVFENVKGLLSHDKGATFNRILEVLNELGYIVKHFVLNTSDFGIPQNRERVWIVGFKNIVEANSFKIPIFEGKSVELRDLLDSEVDKKYLLSEKAIARIKKEVTEIYPTITAGYWKGGHNTGKIPLAILDDGASERYRKVTIDKSPTLKATRSNYAILPTHRRLTPDECFRLQGFKPFEVKQIVSDTQFYKQAGNGQSVNVVERLILELDKSLRL